MKPNTKATKIDCLFSLNDKEILPCDIILTKYSLIRNGTMKDYYSFAQSKTIRKATNGNYSHAILCLSSQSIIEADADGVHTNNLLRLSWTEDCDFNIFRFIRPLTHDEIRTITTFARSRYGVIYSVKGAIGSAANIVVDQNLEFCSRLVARSFASAGINLVQNPDIATPADIENSSMLKQMNFKKRIYLGEALAELVELNSNNPLDEQKEMVTTLYRNIRKSIHSDLMIEEDIINHLNSLDDKEFRRTENILTSIFEESNFLYFFGNDYINCPHSYDFDLCLRNNNKKEISYFNSQISGALEQARIHKNNMECYVKHCRKGAFRTKMLTLYSNLVRQDMRRYTTYSDVKEFVFGK
ncbi:MAG: hypothetical protein IPP69_16700 [Flavobacteriales bacterium]|nr:hypothetical protein [Flavobacteriales bacterium]